MGDWCDENALNFDGSNSVAIPLNYHFKRGLMVFKLQLRLKSRGFLKSDSN